MKKREIQAAMQKCLSEQNAIALEYGFPELLTYTAKYYDNKPREPAHLHPKQNKPKQTDIFYRFGKGISKLIKRIAPR